MRYPQTHNRFTLAKLVTDEGIEGYSAGEGRGLRAALDIKKRKEGQTAS